MNAKRAVNSLAILSVCLASAGCFPEYTFRTDAGGSDAVSTDIGMDATRSDAGGMDAAADVAVDTAADAYVSCRPAGDGGQPDGAGMGPGCDIVPDAGAATFCPAIFPNTDARRLRFLITQLNFTAPASLADQESSGGFASQSIATGGLLLGFEIDLSDPDGGLRFPVRMGGLHIAQPGAAGTGLLGATFAYYDGTPSCGLPDWASVRTTAQFPGQTFQTSPVSVLNLPSFLGPDIYFVMPLRNFVLRNVRMNPERTCVGVARSPYNSCSEGQWITADSDAGDGGAVTIYGEFDAELTVADAMQIYFPSTDGGAASTFCDALAEGVGCSGARSNWRSQPDAIQDDAGAYTAWTMSATFAAVAVNIE